MVSAAQATALGLSRAAICWRRESGAWRPILAGTYLVGAAAYPPRWCDLPFRTRLSAALLTHGDGAVAVLSTAAELHGLGGLPRLDGTIHLRLPPGQERHQQPEVRIHTWLLPADSVSLIGGVRVTTAQRTVADLLLCADRFEGVSLVDAALDGKRLTAFDLSVIERLIFGRRGAVAARSRLAEVNGLAESALETRVRLIACDAGMAPHHLQLPILDRNGVLLGPRDMAWDHPGRTTLVAEADGAEVHGRPEALYRDRRRANDFVSAGGVEVVRFTWEDTLRPAYIVSVLRQNLRAD